MNLDELQLTGKGFVSQGEYLDDNIKLISKGVEFHQVSYSKNHVGWIVMGDIQIMADFTAHTSSGMIGKSVDDIVQFPFIYDKHNRLGDFIGELIELSVEDADKLLQKYKLKKKNNINMDNKFDEENNLVVISTSSNFILVHSDKSSIRVCESEILILSKKNGTDKLVQISNKDGVISLGGKKSIIIQNGNICIDGKNFNPEKIVVNALKSVSESFGNMFN